MTSALAFADARRTKHVGTQWPPRSSVGIFDSSCLST